MSHSSFFTRFEGPMCFSGRIPPVITPHKADGSIDRDGFVEVVQYLIESGVHGVIVTGTTSEYYAQTAEERMSFFKLAQQVIKGRIPWIAGVSAIRPEDCVALAEAAKLAKADGILMGLDCNVNLKTTLLVITKKLC
jgi:4-hydroxy-tetrahydrodipicolinate synthase